MRTFKVFFVYAFTSKENYYSRSDIISVIEEVCEIAQSDSKNKNIKVVPDFYFNEFGNNLQIEIEYRIKNTDLCIIDISENNPNVFYEYGIARGVNCPIIVLKSKKSKNDYSIPSDIVGTHVLFYENIKDIIGRLSNRISNVISEIKHTEQNYLDLARKTWNFGRDIYPSHIYIIAASSETPSKFKEFNSPDHIYLDNLCDKDSILEISVLLGKLYPQSEIKILSIDNLPPSIIEENLVLIGGIGTQNTPNNEIAKKIIKTLRIDISYLDETMVYNGEEFHSQKGNDDFLSLDHAFFGRFDNPLNPNKRVFFAQGIHTFGVLGAIRAFSLHPTAINNHKLIDNIVSNNGNISAKFPINIIQCRVIIPPLTEEFLY